MKLAIRLMRKSYLNDQRDRGSALLNVIMISGVVGLVSVGASKVASVQNAVNDRIYSNHVKRSLIQDVKAAASSHLALSYSAVLTSADLENCLVRSTANPPLNDCIHDLRPKALNLVDVAKNQLGKGNSGQVFNSLGQRCDGNNYCDDAYTVTTDFTVSCGTKATCDVAETVETYYVIKDVKNNKILESDSIEMAAMLCPGDEVLTGFADNKPVCKNILGVANLVRLPPVTVGPPPSSPTTPTPASATPAPATPAPASAKPTPATPASASPTPPPASSTPAPTAPASTPSGTSFATQTTSGPIPLCSNSVGEIPANRTHRAPQPRGDFSSTEYKDWLDHQWFAGDPINMKPSHDYHACRETAYRYDLTCGHRYHSLRSAPANVVCADFKDCKHVSSKGRLDCTFIELTPTSPKQPCRLKYLGCRGASGCFGKDTKITMADSTVLKASEIKVGMHVYNPVTDRNVKVVRVIEGVERQALVEIETDSSFEPLLLTKNHPILTKSGVIPARDLTDYHQLLVVDGDTNELITVAVVKIKEIFSYKPWVWNFELEGSDADDHFLLANGLVSGDLWLQESLETKAALQQ